MGPRGALASAVGDPALRRDRGVRWALDALRALSADDHGALFALLGSAPHRCGALLAPRLDALRLAAARVICAAYRPSLPVAALVRPLGLASPERAEAWLHDCGGVVAKGELDTLASRTSLRAAVAATAPTPEAGGLGIDLFLNNL